MENRFIGELLSMYICLRLFIFLPCAPNRLCFVNIVADGCKDSDEIKLERVIWSTTVTRIGEFRY